jgi:hypothetical protein
MENIELYLLAALAVSEGLALLPVFKGNGILHTVIKLLSVFKKNKK